MFQLHFLMQVPNELVFIGGGYFGLNCMSISTTAGDAKFAAFHCVIVSLQVPKKPGGRWQGYIGLKCASNLIFRHLVAPEKSC